MRTRKMAMVAALLATACGKGSDTRDEPAGPSAATAPAAQAAAKRPMAAPEQPPPDPAGAGPFVIGGGGKRVPAGFPTTFTGPDGPVTVAYTQISGADLGGKIGMVLSFDAKPGEQMALRKPGDPLGARGPASISPEGYPVANPAAPPRTSEAGWAQRDVARQR